MITVFHDEKVWDAYTDRAKARKDEIPLYAIAYDDANQQWWCWYFSWNRIDPDDSRITSSSVCQLYLLVSS